MPNQNVLNDLQATHQPKDVTEFAPAALLPEEVWARPAMFPHAPFPLGGFGMLGFFAFS